MEDCLKIVVTGEVDAGKSTLIGRLLYDMGLLSEDTLRELKENCKRLGRDLEFAYLLDSFEEERMNQLTMDTTQAFCKNKRGRDFLFIDVPGHRELFKNMLCGSSEAEAAIMVVDVKKAQEDGTARHANALKFLGIREIIFVFNKMDSAGFDKDIFENAKEDIEGFCEKIGIRPRSFIPISAKGGDNLTCLSKRTDWYAGPALSEELNRLGKEFKNKNEAEDFYFPVQDVYNLDGEEICVGNIISGAIKNKETVRIASLEREFKLEKIRVFGKIKPLARAKEACGLVLSGPANLVARGAVIFKGSAPEVVRQITAKIVCVCPINLKEEFLLKCATQETVARIHRVNSVLNTSDLSILGEADALKETSAAEVVIAIEEPLVIKRSGEQGELGRFVLERGTEICAAGIII